MWALEIGNSAPKQNNRPGTFLLHFSTFVGESAELSF